MLGALEYVLEEGPGDDWLQDDLIFMLAILGAVAGTAFFWRVFRRESRSSTSAPSPTAISPPAAPSA